MAVDRAALRHRRGAGLRLSAGDEDRRRLVRERRGLALGLLIGALTLGKALPHLIDLPLRRPRGGRRCCSPRAWRWPAASLVFTVGRDGPFVRAHGAFDPHAIRRVLCDPRRAPGDCRLSRTHVGALRDVDVGRRVRHGQLHRRGPADAQRPGSAGRVPRHRQRRGRLRARRLLADRLGKARVARWAWSSAPPAARADRRSCSAAAVVALRPRDGVGLRGRRRLGAILGAGQRVRAARPCRHRAHRCRPASDSC